MSGGGPGFGREIVTLPYIEEYAGGPRRPYLWLELRGPNGQGGPVLGLVDTGADMSVLPLGYAVLMGFVPEDLEPLEIHGVGGQVDAYRPKKPFSAWVAGLESVIVPMEPAFMEGVDALWGRHDFMTVFGVIVEERTAELSLILPPEAEESSG
jgi:hypothetical protein